MKNYSICLKIISLIALITFTFTQFSWGYEGRSASGQPEKSHLRGEQIANAKGIGKEIVKSLGVPDGVIAESAIVRFNKGQEIACTHDSLAKVFIGRRDRLYNEIHKKINENNPEGKNEIEINGVKFFKRLLNNGEVKWAFNYEDRYKVAGMLETIVAADISDKTDDDIACSENGLEAEFFCVGVALAKKVREEIKVANVENKNEIIIKGIRFFRVKAKSKYLTVWAFKRVDKEKFAESFKVEIRRTIVRLGDNEIACSPLGLTRIFKVRWKTIKEKIENTINAANPKNKDEVIIGEGEDRILFFRRIVGKGNIVWAFHKNDIQKVARRFNVKIKDGVILQAADDMPRLDVQNGTAQNGMNGNGAVITQTYRIAIVRIMSLVQARRNGGMLEEAKNILRGANGFLNNPAAIDLLKQKLLVIVQDRPDIKQLLFWLDEVFPSTALAGSTSSSALDIAPAIARLSQSEAVAYMDGLSEKMRIGEISQTGVPIYKKNKNGGYRIFKTLPIGDVWSWVYSSLYGEAICIEKDREDVYRVVCLDEEYFAFTSGDVIDAVAKATGEKIKVKSATVDDFERVSRAIRLINSKTRVSIGGKRKSFAQHTKDIVNSYRTKECKIIYVENAITNEIIGYAVLVEYPRTMTLSYLVVMPSAKLKGVGTVLMMQSLIEAKRSGYNLMRLSSLDQPAKFYRKFNDRIEESLGIKFINEEEPKEFNYDISGITQELLESQFSIIGGITDTAGAAANAAGEEKILLDKDGKFVKKFKRMSLEEFETIEEGTVEDFILNKNGGISIADHGNWITFRKYPRHRATLHIKKIKGGKTVIAKVEIYDESGSRIDEIETRILLDKDGKSVDCFIEMDSTAFEKIKEGTIENFKLSKNSAVSIGGHDDWLTLGNYPRYKVSFDVKKINEGKTVITRVRVYDDSGTLVKDKPIHIVLDKDGSSSDCFINMPSEKFETLKDVTIAEFKLNGAGGLSIGGHEEWLKLSNYPNCSVSFDLIKIKDGKTIIKLIRIYDDNGKQINEVSPKILLDKDGKSVDCFINCESEEFEKIKEGTIENLVLSAGGQLTIGRHGVWFRFTYFGRLVSFDVTKINEGKTVISEIRIYNKAGTHIIRKIKPYQFLDEKGRSLDCFYSRFGYLPVRLRPQKNGIIQGYVLNREGAIGITKDEYYYIPDHENYIDRRIDVVIEDGKKGFLIYDAKGENVEKIIPVGELEPRQRGNETALLTWLETSNLYNEISNIPINEWYDAIVSIEWVTEKKGMEMVGMFNNLIEILSLDDTELALRIFSILSGNATRRTQLNGLIKTKDSLVSQIGNGDLTTKQKRDILIREYLLLLLREISDRTGPVRVRVSKDGTRQIEDLVQVPKNGKTKTRDLVIVGAAPAANAAGDGKGVAMDREEMRHYIALHGFMLGGVFNGKPSELITEAMVILKGGRPDPSGNLVIVTIADNGSTKNIELVKIKDMFIRYKDLKGRADSGVATRWAFHERYAEDMAELLRTTVRDNFRRSSELAKTGRIAVGVSVNAIGAENSSANAGGEDFTKSDFAILVAIEKLKDIDPMVVINPKSIAREAKISVSTFNNRIKANSEVKAAAQAAYRSEFDIWILTAIDDLKAKNPPVPITIVAISKESGVDRTTIYLRIKKSKEVADAIKNIQQNHIDVKIVPPEALKNYLAILNAIKTLEAKNPPVAITYLTVAKEAGISSHTVYRHNKDYPELAKAIALAYRSENDAKILAAVERIKKRDYSGATLLTIAVEAGVSRATVYWRRRKNKEIAAAVRSVISANAAGLGNSSANADGASDEKAKRRTWDEKSIIEAILRIKEAGGNLKSSANNALCMAAIRCESLGSWDAALKAAGLDPEEIKKYKDWTKDKIIAEIKRIHAAGGDLNWSAVQDTNPPLAAAALRYFDSWDVALSAAGLKPEDIRKHRPASLSSDNVTNPKPSGRAAIVLSNTIKGASDGRNKLRRLGFDGIIISRFIKENYIENKGQIKTIISNIKRDLGDCQVVIIVNSFESTSGEFAEFLLSTGAAILTPEALGDFNEERFKQEISANSIGTSL